MRHSSSTNGNWTTISLILLGFWVLSGTGLVLTPEGPARAEAPAQSRYEILKERAEVEEAREKEWRERYAKHAQDVQNARKRLEEIEASHTWTNRGVTRQQEEQALSVLKQAESALDKLHQQARREGVPPGWLRD
ncbi:MAG: hypothetical protein O7B23_00880 [Deltaproteobacteria bacterium]|nr:hypothetical protein [Deltaproteobacteria bacterium]MCZ6715422.1 hypothetical protein [Deltaproteobacteria bacterium]